MADPYLGPVRAVDRLCMNTAPGVFIVGSIFFDSRRRCVFAEIYAVYDHSEPRIFDNCVVLKRNSVRQFKSVMQLKADLTIMTCKTYGAFPGGPTHNKWSHYRRGEKIASGKQFVYCSVFTHQDFFLCELCGLCVKQYLSRKAREGRKGNLKPKNQNSCYFPVQSGSGA